MLPAPPTPDPDSIAAFLDLDGTLIEIADRPDLVRVPGDLLRAIADAAAALGNALAIISGRRIDDIDELLDPLRLAAAGVHGAEVRSANGQVRTAADDRLPALARKRMSALAAGDDGLMLEDKGSSLALHYRQRPELGNKLRDSVRMIAEELGPQYTIQHGKMVAELRLAGASKGTAIETLMSAAPFRGRRPVFFGDDVTDEDGFDIVNRMGGTSVRVGRDDRATGARYQVADVRSVRMWLETVASRGGRDSQSAS